MHTVICDTNIWYEIGENSITDSDIKDLYLIGTSINITEISSSPNLINNIELVIRAIRAIGKHHWTLVTGNPFEYLIHIFNEGFSPNTKVEDKLLKGFNKFINIDISNITDETYEEAQKLIDKLNAPIIESVNTINNDLVKRRLFIKNNERKDKYRSIDFTNHWKKYISDLVYHYSLANCDKGYRININDKNWARLELFIYTWELYFKELELSKKKLNINDWGDLFNLVYVHPGDKYWTKENLWKRIISNDPRIHHYLLKPTEIESLLI